MVNIKEGEDKQLEPSAANLERLLKNFRHWGERWGSKRDEIVERSIHGPRNQEELEEMAQLSVEAMERRGYKTDDSFAMAMGMLEKQYAEHRKHCPKCLGVDR